MQKLGNWRVQICGCTRQALKLYPTHKARPILFPHKGKCLEMA